MNRQKAVVLVLCSAAGLCAQGNPFSDDARQHYAFIKPSLMRAAEKMPEENYSFRTVSEVRTFGEMIAHVADGQLLMCAVVKGETVTANARSKKSKVDLVAALKASFDYCDSAYNTMTDAAGAGKVTMFGQTSTKIGILQMNVAHDNEMYGTMVAYLRIKGIVPPSSEGRPYKPRVKGAGVGRESEGLVVPRTTATTTPFKGRSPALVALERGGKHEGMVR